MKRRIVQLAHIVQKADNVSTEKYGESCIPMEPGELRGYTKVRLKGFCEEEFGGLIGMFKKVPDHVLKIARIVRQPKGHFLILGASGASKTPLSWSDCEDGEDFLHPQRAQWDGLWRQPCGAGQGVPQGRARARGSARRTWTVRL